MASAANSRTALRWRLFAVAWIFAALLLTACKDFPRARTESEIESIAHDAALDATSGRVSDIESRLEELGDEAEEAKQAASDAKSEAEQAKSELQSLRSEYESHRHY